MSDTENTDGQKQGDGQGATGLRLEDLHLHDCGCHGDVEGAGGHGCHGHDADDSHFENCLDDCCWSDDDDDFDDLGCDGLRLGRFHRIPAPPAVFALGVATGIDLTLKFLAIRRAIKLGDEGWVLPLALINSVGILPAVFLKTHPMHTRRGRR